MLDASISTVWHKQSLFLLVVANVPAASPQSDKSACRLQASNQPTNNINPHGIMYVCRYNSANKNLVVRRVLGTL